MKQKAKNPNLLNFSKPSNLHANLVQAQQKGILILGQPGAGKSKITLDLLDRGYFFVCDDLVCLAWDPLTQKIIGSRPETQARMHIRGQGFLDIDELYPQQILEFSSIDFILPLTHQNKTHSALQEKLLDPIWGPILAKVPIIPTDFLDYLFLKGG